MCVKKVVFVVRRRKILYLLIKFYGIINFIYLFVFIIEDKDMFIYNLLDV